MTKPRAIGIVRVSNIGGRETERFHSPTVQATRVRDACTRENLELLRIVEELDVSGGRELDKRPGLGPAVQAIENGEAEVIVGAYFDRLFRSLKAQGEAIERVERAGGRVLAVDVGDVSAGSAGQWLSGTLMGAVSEYFRRATAERVQGGIQAAIDRGVPPYGRVPVGYVKTDRGVYVPGPLAPAVLEAFEMRAAGMSQTVVWEMMSAAGATLTAGGVYQMWRKRVYLGEIHFGEFTPNLAAHEPIVPRELWERVQGMRAPSGRKGQSERLLARLGVLRCGTCDSRMVGSVARNRAGGSRYPIYRCNNRECSRRVSLMAWIADAATVEAVKVILADIEGRAEVARDALEAVAAFDHAQRSLDALIAMLDPLEPASQARLVEATGKRDAARAEADRLRGFSEAQTVSADDIETAGVDRQRDLIRRTLRRVIVLPASESDRLRFEPVA